MKKYLILIFIMVLLSVKVQGQNIFSIGAYGTVFNQDTKNASRIGIGSSFTLFNIYIDFSSNLAKGKGEYLNYSSSYTTSANKKAVSVFNVGYVFSFKKLKAIPLVGVGYVSNIYEDPLLFDSYYLGDKFAKLNVGFVLAYPILDFIDVTVGGGIFEMAKIGLSMKVF